jgi:hypothetical protein
MREQTATASPQKVEKSASAQVAVMAAQDAISEQPAQSRIALTVRSRRVMRMAPPIDNGFRPFRVF